MLQARPALAARRVTTPQHRRGAALVAAAAKPPPPAAKKRGGAAASSPAPPSSPADEPLSGAESAVVAAGGASLPLVFWSEVALATTGCGLPPGNALLPAPWLGAAEGVSYLGLVALLALSAKRKLSTGVGLPGVAAGGMEGLAFLVALGGIGVAAFTIATTGGLPGALPDARCFG
jgi:hypothetical protein